MKKMVTLKPLHLFIAGAIILGGVGLLVFKYVLNDSPEQAQTVEVDPTASALQTSKEAIKDGITKENLEEALFIASQYANTGEHESAVDLLNKIDDTTTNNQQLISKYTVLLDIYRQTNQKDQYVEKAEQYKTVLLSRNDPQLNEISGLFTQQYYDLVFDKSEIPVEKEIE